jgi:two-component system chemotaxis response regulator CheY
MKGKILFVDDSPVIKKVVKKSIEAIGYELIEASDGKQGLSILAKEYNDVKVILSDWNMPVMNGFDFLKAVKANNSYKHIPVIMITTESEKSNINSAIGAGASNYLLKPFKNEELTDKILKILC